MLNVLKQWFLYVLLILFLSLNPLWICFFIGILINWIILIVDYADIEKSLGPGQQIPSHEWAAVFVPSIISLLCSIIMGVCVFSNVMVVRD